MIWKKSLSLHSHSVPSNRTRMFLLPEVPMCELSILRLEWWNVKAKMRNGQSFFCLCILLDALYMQCGRTIVMRMLHRYNSHEKVAKGSLPTYTTWNYAASLYWSCNVEAIGHKARVTHLQITYWPKFSQSDSEYLNWLKSSQIILEFSSSLKLIEWRKMTHVDLLP